MATFCDNCQPVEGGVPDPPETEVESLRRILDRQNRDARRKDDTIKQLQGSVRELTEGLARALNYEATP